MKVLMLDEGVGAGGLVESDLVDAGHEVLRCRAFGQPAFPCVGVLDRELCPLESSSVDVAVKVGGADAPYPGRREQGVVCALRRRVPLVLAGSPPDPELAGLATAVAEGHDDVVHLVETTAGTDIRELSVRARAAALGVLERHGLTHVDVVATVVRHDGGLVARLQADEAVAAALREVASVQVHAALSRLMPDATTISVSFASAS